MFLQVSKKDILTTKANKPKSSIIRENYADFALLGLFGLCAFTGQVKYVKMKTRQE